MKKVEFLVTTSSGQSYRLTADQLMVKVIEDSKCLPFYGWSLPISEIVRVMEEPEFPANYSERIRRQIIASFNSIYEHDVPRNVEFELAEMDSIWQCFHDIRESGNREVCKTFIEKLIDFKISQTDERFHHPGSDYKLFVRAYAKEKKSNWRKKEGKELEEFIDSIPDELKQRVERAEGERQFEKSDAEAWGSVIRSRWTMGVLL